MLFVTQEELLRAKTQINVYPYNKILPKLIENANRAVAISPKLLSSAPSSNLFVLQNVFLELSLAALLTTNEKYQQCATDIARQIDNDAWRRQFLPEEIHLAFVLNGLAVFFDLLGDRLDSTNADQFRRTIGAIAEQLIDASRKEEWGRKIRKRNAWNHSIVPFSAIGVAGLVLPGSSTASGWIKTAKEHLALFCHDGITEAGMTREGLTYCGFVFRNAGLFLRGLKNSLGDSFLSEKDSSAFDKFSRIPEWYAAETFPGGKYLQNYNDSYWDPHPALRGFLLMFGERNPDLCSYVWENLVGASGLQTFGQDLTLRNSSLFEAMLWHPGSRQGVLTYEPVKKVFSCPEVGYFCEHESWSRDASVFSFNCGEFIGAIHDQADNNSFTFFARGVPIILDAGAANKAEEGSASSSFGHSSLLIDGKGQHPCGAGHGVSGKIINVEIGETATTVQGDATESYNRLKYNPVRWAFRQCVFAKEPFPYLLAFDDVRKDEESHEFEFVFHTPTFTAPPQVTGETVSGEISFEGKSCAVTIDVLNPQEVTIQAQNYSSVHQPPFAEHQLWRVATQAVNPYFLVLIVPGEREDVGAYTATVKEEEEEIIVDLTWTKFSVRNSFRFLKKTLAGRGSFFDSLSKALPWRSQKPLTQPLPSEASGRTAVVSPLPVTAPRAEENRISLAALDQILTTMRNDPAYLFPPTTGIVMAQSGFRDIGLEFFEYFVKFGGLQPTDSVLDIGCGGGRMAVPLTYYLREGKYAGFDIHKPSIDWCKKHISTRSSHFRFDFVDLYNGQYNPLATTNAENFIFPYQNTEFSFCISTSVFTHMFREEVANYLREMFRVLKPGGVVCCTAYLLNDCSLSQMVKNSNAVKFPFEYRGARIHIKDRPYAAVGHFEEQFRSVVSTAGFAIDKIMYGSWSGIRGFTTKQDLVILRKI